MNHRTTDKPEPRSLDSVCYICGGDGPDSRDHVIPDCFFKSPRPANLLTLPAHYACHNRLDDEYARDILSGLGSEASGVAQELWNTKTKRSFERSAPLRKSLQASLVRKIDLISPAGLVFDQAPAIRIERDRFYPLMRKIVQGMYLHHTGELLPPMFRSTWSLRVAPPNVNCIKMTDSNFNMNFQTVPDTIAGDECTYPSTPQGMFCK